MPCIDLKTSKKKPLTHFQLLKIGKDIIHADQKSSSCPVDQQQSPNFSKSQWEIQMCQHKHDRNCVTIKRINSFFKAQLYLS